MSNDVEIRTRQIGDIGWMFMRQAEMYAKEYGYSEVFETYVARSLPSFLDHFDAAKDGLWIAERDGRRLGCIAIQNAGKVAQLRYYFVEKAARGTGIGTRLMEQALQFCEEVGYGEVVLWTCSDLVDAAHMYQRHGFDRVDQTPCPWKDGIVQEKWRLQLSSKT